MTLGDRIKAARELMVDGGDIEDSIKRNENGYNLYISYCDNSGPLYFLELAKSYLNDELRQRIKKIHKDHC